MPTIRAQDSINNNINEDDSSSPEVSSEEESLASASERNVEFEKASKVRASFNAPAYWVMFAGVLLALCAGIVNVTMLLRVGKVVSHVTGHLTAIGLRLEGARIGYFHGNSTWIDEHTESLLTQQELVEHLESLSQAVIVTGSFMFGSFLCGLVIPHNVVRFGGKAFYGLALILNSVLLVAGFLALHFGFENLSLAATACAMGLQNAMCTMHLGAVVRTTHVTGTSTDIGSTLGRASMILLRKGCRRRRLTVLERAEVEVDLTKMRVLLAIWSAFMLGCFLGAWLYNFFGFYTLLVPANITLCMGIIYWCFRDLIKKRLKEMLAEQLHDEMQSVTDIIVRLKSEREFRSERGEFGSEGSVFGPSRAGTVRSQQELDEEETEMENMLQVLHNLQEDALGFYGEEMPRALEAHLQHHQHHQPLQQPLQPRH